MKNFLLFCIVCLASFFAGAQVCNAPGQKPSTAFPVCGTSVFTQTTVPLCAGNKLPSPSCNNDPISDVNPFWYKFTCFQSGTLSFTITPKQLSDDYDWELYDVTGRNPDDIYKDGKMVIACNWSGEGGKTGAAASGKSLMVCAGFGKDVYSKMPNLEKDHNYLLLISHFTQSQSGYDLEFKGGTAVITDTLTPQLKRAEITCSGSVIKVALNKKMKCSSIAADGSDFVIPSANAQAIKATGIYCVGGFDTDSIEVTLNRPLPPGNYRLQVKQGSDGNAILDVCDNAISSTNFTEFTVLPTAPTSMDKMAALTCSPQQIKLLFAKPILCNSIASNGSDFLLTGNYAATINSAEGTCNANGTTKEIILTLAKPLQTTGSFVLTLKKGGDGNTLLDECAMETPAGSSISFDVKDTVNANFTTRIRYGCTMDTVYFTHNGGNSINSWSWNMDDGMYSSQQKPTAFYTDFSPKNIQLVVSNGFCHDTANLAMVLDNYLKADFNVQAENCPKEPITFANASQGKLRAYAWDFGEGGKATTASPKYTFQQPTRDVSYNVRLTVTDRWGCSQTVTKPVKIFSSCDVYVPNAFSPGNDGRNDVFRILNAVKTKSFEFKVFNRWGQLLYSSTDWRAGWDGRFKGLPQDAGTYIWMVRYTDTRSKQVVERKGTFLLMR